MKWHKHLITILIFTAIAVITPLALWAQVSSSVNIRVKISVCGNGIKEGGEECDQTDLDSKTCLTQGYLSGTLTCDYSCFFDYSSCSMSLPTPTPTPSPTPTPTPTPTPSPTATPTSTVAATSTPSPTVVSTSSPTPLSIASTTLIPTSSPRATASPRASATIRPGTSAVPSPYSQLFEPDLDQGKTAEVAKLPWQLALFDLDNSGKIEGDELFPAAKSWLEEKKKVDSPNFATIGQEKESLACDLNNDKVCNIIDFSLLLYFVDR